MLRAQNMKASKHLCVVCHTGLEAMNNHMERAAVVREKLQRIVSSNVVLVHMYLK